MRHQEFSVQSILEIHDHDQNWISLEAASGLQSGRSRQSLSREVVGDRTSKHLERDERRGQWSSEEA